MLTLSIEKRIKLGKASKNLGKELIPAVYYGSKEKSTPIAISGKAFKKVFKEAGESSVIVLKDGDKELETLIHDIDFDPLRGEPRHVDFYVIEKGKKVEVEVPLHFEGIPPAVKNLGGILVKVLREIEIEAMPKDIPHSIIVNVEVLETLDSQIKVKDLVMPSGVTTKASLEEVVASITVAKEEVEETAPIDLSSIEVEKKGKQEEEGAEGGSASEKAPEKK